MMKPFLILLCLISFSAKGFCQTRKIKGNGNIITKEKKVLPYNKVIVEDGLDVTLLYNPFDNKIGITSDANLQQIISYSVEKDVLTLKIKDGFAIVNKTENFKITLTSKEINSIVLKGNSNIEGTGIIEIPRLELTNNGNGNISLKIKTEEVEITNNDNGLVDVAGSSNIASVRSKGNGDTKLEDLSTFFMELHSSGNGNIYTNVVNGIDGTLSGSGNVFYRNTKTVNIETTGSGQVIKQQ